MTKFKEFLKKIHVPSDTIEKIENADDAEIDGLVKHYLKEREDYAVNTKLSDKVKEEIDRTVKGLTLKAIKQVNKSFGFDFTNAQMEEYASIEAFMSDAEKKHKDHISEMAKGEKEDLIKQINTLKESISVKQQEIDREKAKTRDEIKRLQTEKDNEIRLFKAKDIFDNLVKNDKDLPDVPGKNFMLESIREKIFAQYDVQADGSLLNKDGTTPIHPDPDRPVVVKNISEIYPWYKSLAGLTKVNNAGEGGEGEPEHRPGGGSMGASEKFFLEQIR